MTAERESMTLQEMDAPALGVEERRDEAPGAGASHARPTPDPEVVAKPKRRKFTAQYRLRILEEAESCTQPGEVGRLLRREGLYSSHLTEWRRARREGSLQGLTPSKRGRKPAERNPLSAKVHELEAKVARLEKERRRAERWGCHGLPSTVVRGPLPGISSPVLRPPGPCVRPNARTSSTCSPARASSTGHRPRCGTCQRL